MKKISFILVLLFCVPLAAAQTTKQRPFAVPYSSIENLYLDVDRSLFLSLGVDLDRASIVAEDHGRRYSVARIDDLGDREPLTFAGDTIFLFETHHMHDIRNLVTHLFHVQEHLIGAWAGGADQRPERVLRVVFVGSGAPIVNWRGINEGNYHLIKALFPNATVLTLAELRSSFPGRVLHFSRAFVADRGGEDRSDECVKLNKMLGSVRHKISPSQMEKFMERVWKYADAKQKDLFQVVYVRREPPRRLEPSLEERLLTEIRKIQGVDLRVVDFAKMSFKEQIQCDRETDVLIGVHGNGLAHVLFIKPTGTLIEIFPRDLQNLCHVVYSDLRKLSYYGIHEERGFVSKEIAYEEGEKGWEGLNREVVDIDIPLVVGLIEEKVFESGKQVMQ